MRDFRKAFGSAPENFNDFVAQSLLDEMRGKPVKKKMRVSTIVLAAVLLLALAGTAVAITSQWGVLEFQDRHGSGVLPEAQELVVDLSSQAPIATSEVSYQVRDAMIDGKRAMLTIICTPLVDDILLVEFMSVATDPMEGMDMSYAEVAAAEGKRMVQVGSPLIAIDGMEMRSLDSVHEGSNLIYYIELECTADLPEGDITAKYTMDDWTLFGTTETHAADGSIYYDNDNGPRNETDGTFTFTYAKPQMTNASTLRFEGPFEAERMTVNWIELERTPVSTYLRLEYTAHEDLSSEDIEAMELMFFNIMQSEEDEAFPTTGGGGGSTPILPEGEGWGGRIAGITFLEETTWDAMAEFPEKIYLKPYYKLIGQWGDAIVLDTASAK